MKNASLSKDKDFGLPGGTVRVDYPKFEDVTRVRAGDCAILCVSVRDGDDWSPWSELQSPKTNPWFSLKEAWEIAERITAHLKSEHDEVVVRVLQLRIAEKPKPE